MPTTAHSQAAPSCISMLHPGRVLLSLLSSGHALRLLPSGGRSSTPPKMTAAIAAEPAPLTATSTNTELKMRLLQLAAGLDRGQSYNPTSSGAYEGRMSIMNDLLKDMISQTPPLPTSLTELEGEWELVFTNVAHGIFRSSPFFLAIREAYSRAGAPDKAELFFKLHELQTCSWGVSKIGRVAQLIDSSKGMLYSEFDTNLLSLTVIPVLGWFKLVRRSPPLKRPASLPCRHASSGSSQRSAAVWSPRARCSSRATASRWKSITRPPVPCRG